MIPTLLRNSFKWRRADGGARGQSLVIVTLALPVLIGGLALVFDIGDLYVTRVLLQTSSDAAVLAGGNYLPSYPDQAISTARDYAMNNGIAAAEIQSISVSPDSKAVMISVSRQVPCYFCAALGVTIAHAATTNWGGANNGTVSATATAVIVPVRSARGVVPLGIDYRTNLNFGNEVILKQGQVGPGNWDPLALGGPGANIYRDNLANGYSGLLTVGDLLTTETGNIVGPTNQAIDQRITAGQSQFPSGTFAQHALNDPRVMVVPMVDFSNINGNSDVPLKGFAVMWVVSSDNHGNITSYFIQQSVPGALPETDPNALSFGGVMPTLK